MLLGVEGAVDGATAVGSGGIGGGGGGGTLDPDVELLEDALALLASTSPKSMQASCSSNKKSSSITEL